MENGFNLFVGNGYIGKEGLTFRHADWGSSCYFDLVIPYPNRKGKRAYNILPCKAFGKSYDMLKKQDLQTGDTLWIKGFVTDADEDLGFAVVCFEVKRAELNTLPDTDPDDEEPHLHPAHESNMYF